MSRHLGLFQFPRGLTRERALLRGDGLRNFQFPRGLTECTNCKPEVIYLTLAFNSLED